MIQAGQIYRSADPRDDITILIESYRPGDLRAHVVDAHTGKRPRQVLVRNLHESAYTKQGAKRRTGYILQSGASE